MMIEYLHELLQVYRIISEFARDNPSITIKGIEQYFPFRFWE